MAIYTNVSPDSVTLIQGDVVEYTYTGNYQSVTLPPGIYKLECWGAQGGRGCKNGALVSNSAYGGFSSGNIIFNQLTELHVYVGGKGGNGSSTANTYATAGWNGGGRGGSDTRDDDGAGAGGGASDIRLIGGLWDNINSLKSRIIVAGGSSGSTFDGVGGHGGGLNGQTKNAFGGYQVTGYSFGVGENGKNNIVVPSSGAGGGYYGGFSATGGDNEKGVTISGGGSGFISGMDGCDAIDENGNHTGQPIHYSGLFFTDCKMQTGVREGDGYITITYLGLNDEEVTQELHILLEVGEQIQLIGNVLPEKIGDPNLEWNSSLPNIASVDSTGKVTANAEGITRIQVKTKDGTWTDYALVEVVTKGVGDQYRLSILLKVGESCMLKFAESDQDIIIWKSSTTAVATVNPSNTQITKVTAQSKGLTLITVQTADGSKSDQIYVTVIE